MTLSEVQELTGVPASYILEQLDLPQTTLRNERIGRLRQQHGFQMEDLRRVVAEYEAQ